jgi:hypothetical protein
MPRRFSSVRLSDSAPRNVLSSPRPQRRNILASKLLSVAVLAELGGKRAIDHASFAVLQAQTDAIDWAGRASQRLGELLYRFVVLREGHPGVLIRGTPAQTQ